MSDIKKQTQDIYSEYKPNITSEQKTPKNMFLLGAEAVLIRVQSKRSINNNPTGVPYCCDIKCNNDATWELRFSSELEDYTQVCECHLLNIIPEDCNELTLTRISK